MELPSKKATTPERDAIAALLQLSTPFLIEVTKSASLAKETAFLAKTSPASFCQSETVAKSTKTTIPPKNSSPEDVPESITTPNSTYQSSSAPSTRFDETVTSRSKKSDDAQECSPNVSSKASKSSICEILKLKDKFTPPPGGVVMHEFSPSPSTGRKASTTSKASTAHKVTAGCKDKQANLLMATTNNSVLAIVMDTKRKLKQPGTWMSGNTLRLPMASATSEPSQSSTPSAISVATTSGEDNLTSLDHDFDSPVTIADVIRLRAIEEALLSDSYVLKGSFLEYNYPDDHPHVVAFNQAGFADPSKFFQLESCIEDLYVAVESREAAQVAEELEFDHETDWTNTLAQENAELLRLYNTVNGWEAELTTLRRQLERANAGPEGVYNYKLNIQYRYIGNQDIPLGYIKPKKTKKKATPKPTKKVSTPPHNEACSSTSASTSTSAPTPTPTPTKQAINLTTNPISKFLGPNANKPPVKKSKRILEDVQDFEIPSAKKVRAGKAKGGDVPAGNLENVRTSFQVARDIGAKYIELARIQEELDNLLKEKAQLEKK